MFEKSDEKLIQGALAGNRKAWFSLLSRYEQAIYNYGIRMTANSHDAKDLMQDIFLSVYRNLKSYQGTGAFKSWLFRIAHHRCVEYYRRRKPNVSIDDCPDVSEATTNVCPELSMMGNQSQQALYKAMQLLPISQRAVVELKFFSQFTFEEISEQLGVSANTVKSRLYTALTKLKAELEVEYV